MIINFSESRQQLFSIIHNQKLIDQLTNELKKNKKFNLSDVSLDDKKTFQMLSSGSTTGVFQLESAGMKDVLIGLKPDRFEDIIAVVSLYRPGPMENIPTYINRKHGKEEIAYMHPDLEEILGKRPFETRTTYDEFVNGTDKASVKKTRKKKGVENEGMIDHNADLPENRSSQD